MKRPFWLGMERDLLVHLARAMKTSFPQKLFTGLCTVVNSKANREKGVRKEGSASFSRAIKGGKRKENNGGCFVDDNECDNPGVMCNMRFNLLMYLTLATHKRIENGAPHIHTRSNLYTAGFHYASDQRKVQWGGSTKNARCLSLIQC